MQYIVEYDSSWRQRFSDIARTVQAVLPDGCRIHHVGSTAIPGMPAKDIIDLDIECGNGGTGDVIRALAGTGYEHQGDLGITGREAFRVVAGSAAESRPPHHLYVCEERASELRRHLAFRDFLIAHPERMAWLAEQKRQADRGARTRDEYIENKAEAYAAIVAEAVLWTCGSRM